MPRTKTAKQSFPDVLHIELYRHVIQDLWQPGKKFSCSEVRFAVLLKTHFWEVRSCRLSLSKKISLGPLDSEDEGTVIRETLAIIYHRHKVTSRNNLLSIEN